MGFMLDPRLVGYWSDQDLYQGAMEAADIAFRADGTGWTYWSRDGGSFYVLRFSWHTAHGQLTLHLREHLFGMVVPEGSGFRHRVDSQDAWDQQLVLAYEVAAGQNLFRKPAMLLELDQPISLGTIDTRFALQRELAEDEHDPTRSGWKLRPPG